MATKASFVAFAKFSYTSRHNRILLSNMYKDSFLQHIQWC